MESSSEENDEGVEIGPYLEEQELQRQAQEEAEKQTWKYKWEHLPTREKIYVVGIITSLVLPILMATLIYPALEPHPDTEVEYCNFRMGAGETWEILDIKIKNDGSDETAEVTLQITLPDNMSFNYDDIKNNKCSIPPDYEYKEEDILVFRWNFILPHTSVEISQHIDFKTFESSVPVWPEHIVVSSKGEHGPIYEYPS